MDNNVKKALKDFEERTANYVIYLTKSGSKLYGTDNENSDTDYKGIFIPAHDDVILKKDLPHYSNDTNPGKTKNTNEDIDFHLDSVYSFFRNLKKGETGAIDLLFSMFRQDTIMEEDTMYTNVLRKHYKKFLNRRLHSFVGYCVGQSKKYNIKGNRYKELVDFNEKLDVWVRGKKAKSKVDDGNGSWESLKAWVLDQNYKYIKFIRGKGSMTSLDVYPEIEYLEVLGSKYAGYITIAELCDRVVEMEDQFGNRTKAQGEGPDWKALSHAIRVIYEVEELLDTGFIKFPLEHRTYIKSVKEGHETLEDVMKVIDASLDVVNKKLEDSTLPEQSDEAFMNSLMLMWVKADDGKN